MTATVQHQQMTAPVQEIHLERASVLKVLAYFDIFHYPLTKKEISQFLDQPINDSLVEIVVEDLLTTETIFCFRQLYGLQNNPLPACKRAASNKKAATLLPKANKVGRFLYQFPFVRGIGISGSLSKNVADEKADFDFFVITKTNRLWIARTLMHAYKKLTYLTGRQHFHCMNYYIDEESLLLQEQNVFTAMEIKTLIPVSGEKTMQEFFFKNQWADQWLPACPFKQQHHPDKNTIFKRVGEWLFNLLPADRVDNLFLRISRRRWEKKEQKGKLNDKGQRMGLMTNKHFAKSNPGAFQEKVLTMYRDKLERLGL